MRSFIIALAAGGCLVSTMAAQETFPKSFYDELKTYNIELYAGFPHTAKISLKDAKTLKGMELLRAAKSLAYVDLDMQNSESTEEYLKLLAGFADLSTLQIRNGTLKEKDIERIGALKSLSRLMIEYPEFTDHQLKQLEPLKTLKQPYFIELRYKNFVTPDLEARLERAFSGRPYLFLVEDISWRLAKTVNIGANEDQLTKLKKQKFITAAKALQASFEATRNSNSSSSSGSSSSSSSGSGSSGSAKNAREGWGDFAAAAKMMKDAVLELDDRQLALDLVNDYVRYIEKAHTACEKRFHEKSLSASEYHFVQYSLLDAQILQLQLRKQLQKKTP
jgi:uncharacterized membrane protein YgcG